MNEFEIVGTLLLDDEDFNFRLIKIRDKVIGKEVVYDQDEIERKSEGEMNEAEKFIMKRLHFIRSGVYDKRRDKQLGALDKK
ncbi:hypothetical protein [Gracilibacillus sp. YIM 98692]|uniref:hypothetical protein n=1 Tax=Gracilibacillus sp. YIM 98692 TaxID=2663532 RepID=UPI0013D401E5|nr:hypothetical protein [Gracilibacillus sp. YIM 98692]